MLTNVSYRRYISEDVGKTSFVIDVFPFITQNLNPTGLDRKLEIPLKRDYVKMIWDSYVPNKCRKFIYQKENFIELSQTHITYWKAKNIVLKFVEEGAQKIDLLKSALRDHFQTIQYVNSLLFSKIYSRTNRFGINKKSHFDFIFIIFAFWYNTAKTTTTTTTTTTIATMTTKWTRKRRNCICWKKVWKLRKKSRSFLWTKTRKK